MKRPGWSLAFVLVLALQAPAFENLAARGLIAIPKDGGNIFLSWRFLEADPETTVFDVYRKPAGGDFSKIATVTTSANFEDSNTVLGTTYSYYVRPVDGEEEGPASNTATATSQSSGRRGYLLDIYGPMPDPYNPAHMTGCPQNKWWKSASGDLNGDGLFDYVISWGCRPDDPHWPKVNFKVPPFPYDTQHIQAYLHDGTFLGWQYETGCSYGYNRKRADLNVLFVVYDLDGDGLAEIITKRDEKPIDYQYSVETDDYIPNTPDEIAATSGNRDYRLVVLNGMTGEVKAQTLWPVTEAMPASAIGIAYLHVSEGDKTPSVIVQEGTYDRIKLKAYRYTGSTLVEEWTNPVEDCRTGHTIQILDFDGDGNDEFVLGCNVIDENGQLLWRYPGYHAHGDFTNVGDLDSGVSGFEAIFGLEHYDGQVKNDGIILFTLPNTPSSSSVTVLDTIPSVEPHGNVMNIDANTPGLEIKWSGEKEGWTATDPPSGLVRCYNGTITEVDSAFGSGFGNHLLEWDGDDSSQEWLAQIEQIPIQVREYTGSGQYQTIDSLYGTGGAETLRAYCIGDIMGDFRDEIITPTAGTGDGSAGITVLTSTDGIDTRRPTPMEDRYYRFRFTQWAVYYQYNQNGLSMGIDIPPPDGTLQISGRVTENGEGLAGVVLTLNGTGSRTASTAESGDYYLVALAEGAYTITPSRPGYSFGPPSLDVILTPANSPSNDFAATWILPVEKTIAPASGKAYCFRRLVPGTAPYIDRDYQVQSVPEEYESGYVLIATAMDDKTAADNPLITLTAAAQAEVVVCWPDSMTVPSWLSSWTNTGHTITVDCTPHGLADYGLYSRSFPPGSIGLGPALGSSMYFVLVKETGGDGEPFAITHVLAASGREYPAAYLTVGDCHYTDRAYTLESIPPALSGLLWIRTAMEDKNHSATPFLTYEVNRDVTVYVGIYIGDAAPSWLASDGWTATGLQIAADHSPYDDHALFNIHAKVFPQEQGVSIGNTAGLGCMYIVLNEPVGAKTSEATLVILR